MASAIAGGPDGEPATRRSCAFLTMRGLGERVTDHGRSRTEMRALGWDVRLLEWRDSAVDWDRFDAVCIGTAWDYPQDPWAFLDLLERIDASRAVLVNDFELVWWTFRKTDLGELEACGVDIVPSAWHRSFDRGDVPGYISVHGVDTVVIKPQLGANAVDTHVVEAPVSDSRCPEPATIFRDRPIIVQPFVASIRSEGEYSLIYPGGEFSHAIVKKPKAGDFRVQEEHGAEIRPLASRAGPRRASWGS